MKQSLGYFLTTYFAVFLGSQITEGFLLVPYWKSLSRIQFYEYYSNFGSLIGSFYTTLTITSVLITVFISIYSYIKKSSALKYSIVSTTFALLVIALFYYYFKGANQQFYNNAFNVNQLKSELEIWENWHWIRVFFELLSLIFLITTINILTDNKKLQTT